MTSQNQKSKIQLLDYQLWRMSFRNGHAHSIVAENGNCEGFLELDHDGTFLKRFFILNIEEMKFKYFRDNPKKNRNECVGYIDIRYITKVSKITYKPKKPNMFEVNIPSRKYVLCAASDVELTNWVDALTKAAVTPSRRDLKDSLRTMKASSLESLDETKTKSFQTSIIGGVVIKTPVTACASSLPVDRRKIKAHRSNSTSASTSGLKSIFEGWCWKQGCFMKNWKRRYFRLNAVRLSYYETNCDEKAPIRTIITHDIQGVRILPRFCNRKNCLEVETPYRKFYMHPDNENEVEQWQKAIEEVIASTGMFLPRTNSF